ncbi:hypothetical protein GCM10009107_37660 [Ideonella azotifigens]|uniref:Uncharacterized protein n=1 Tax=Ideonella azotifigens TaxID=513160 RepID=A0ABN1K817_9BURK
MVQPLLLQRVRQGAHHMVLADHFLEAAGAVLARQDDITHPLILRLAGQPADRGAGHAAGIRVDPPCRMRHPRFGSS